MHCFAEGDWDDEDKCPSCAAAGHTSPWRVSSCPACSESFFAAIAAIHRRIDARECPYQGLMMPFEKPTAEQLSHRYDYHAPKGDQVGRYAEVRHAIKQAAATCVGLTPCTPEQTRALNALDEACFLFNAAIARGE